MNVFFYGNPFKSKQKCPNPYLGCQNNQNEKNYLSFFSVCTGNKKSMKVILNLHISQWSHRKEGNVHGLFSPVLQISEVQHFLSEGVPRSHPSGWAWAGRCRLSMTVLLEETWAETLWGTWKRKMTACKPGRKVKNNAVKLDFGGKTQGRAKQYLYPITITLTLNRKYIIETHLYIQHYWVSSRHTNL